MDDSAINNIVSMVPNILCDLIKKDVTCSHISFEFPRRYGKSRCIQELSKVCVKEFPDKSITVVCNGLKDSSILDDTCKNKLNIFNNFQELSSDDKTLLKTEILLLDETVPEEFLPMLVVSFKTPRF